MRLKTDKTGDPPSTAWIGAALLAGGWRRVAVCIFFLLACISVCLGLPHWGFRHQRGRLAVLLPGWLLAVLVFSPGRLPVLSHR